MLVVLLFAPDARTQTAPADPILFWIDDDGIQRVDPGKAAQRIVGTGSALPMGLAVDTAAGSLYWTQLQLDEPDEDEGLASIWRVLADGSDAVVVAPEIICGMTSVHGCALAGDWVYWSNDSICSGFGRVMPGEGGTAAETFFTAPWHVHRFALDVEGGFIYWTASHFNSSEYSIRRGTLEAEDSVTLVLLDESPQGIALDMENAHLYWSQGNRIMRSDLDGNEVQEVLDSGASITHLELFTDGRLYWSAVHNLIRRANRDGSGMEDFYQIPAEAGFRGFALYDPDHSSSSTPGATPSGVVLEQSYPNPATGAATIHFELAESAQVRLEVFDLLGRRVATLVDGPTSSGSQSVTFDTSGLPSGVYVYRLTSGATVVERRLTVIG
ncbi:hypothetical protein BH23BAC4_BH23BAC4_09130 [soil metagenome]